MFPSLPFIAGTKGTSAEPGTEGDTVVNPRFRTEAWTSPVVSRRPTQVGCLVKRRMPAGGGSRTTLIHHVTYRRSCLPEAYGAVDRGSRPKRAGARACPKRSASALTLRTGAARRGRIIVGRGSGDGTAHSAAPAPRPWGGDDLIRLPWLGDPS